jgi:hypothetical protein
MPHSDRKQRLAYQRKLRNKRRRDGVCLVCAGPRDSVFLGCSDCRQKSNKIVMRILRRNIRNGKCACGKTRLKEKMVCKKCASVSKLRQRRLKKEVIAGYGGCCACCGEKQWQFLSVDHKKNDGAKRRRERGRAETSSTLYRRLIKEKFPSDYQILCFNCNMALGFFGYCPHNPNVRRSRFRS